MTQSRIELKVGLFVVICLALMALLLIQFSKGVSIFKHTYQITLNTANVGGLRARASVLMSGVKVGIVSRTRLSEQGTNVAVELDIYDDFVIRDDAVFKIEQSGFLGDQYVAIYPGHNAGARLQPGAQARVAEPFNLEEVASSANDLIRQVGGTLTKLDQTIDAVRKTALDGKTLTNFAEIIENFQKASCDARTAVAEVNLLMQNNGGSASSAVSNLLNFTRRLDGIGDRAQGLLDSNAPQINSTIGNIQVSSVALTNLLYEIEAGNGVAGTIIKNQQMAQNASALVSNLALTSSELNRLGFWHWMFHTPKESKTNAAPEHPEKKN